MTRIFGLSGLCATVLGLLAFNATVAHAESGAQWLYAEAWPGSSLIPFKEERLELESTTNLILHTKIAGVTVLFECVWVETGIAQLLANGSIGGLSGLAKEAKFRFSHCSTHLNGILSAPCVPIDKNGSGEILTTLVHGLITLTSSKEERVQILPDTGETLATIEMGEECAIGKKVPVIGKVFITDSEGKFLTHLARHSIEVGSPTELWAISKTAEHTAALLGRALAFLFLGAGIKFSGDPA